MADPGMMKEDLTTSEPATPRLNLDEPMFDQNVYMGRAKHFLMVTNPLNVLLSNAQLDEAKKLVQLYREGKEPAGTSNDEVWTAKYRYDSAFHPDTKEKMMLIGRMSAQVPMNMCITGCMMTFYRTTPAVLFWQWFNQSFNAVVNYTNRSGDKPIPVSQLGKSYALATVGAVGSAIGLNSLVKSAPPIIGRMVPFAAVCAANCINIPMMRSAELANGIPVFDENGHRLGNSKKAAKSAITQVVISRIFMAMPGMLLPAFVMNKLDKGTFLKRYPYLGAPIQVSMVGIMLLFATPMCCALFPQKSSLPVSSLEEDLQTGIQKRGGGIDRVYFNKGL
ncbi:sideroflexin-1 [Strongylocentrotus purpuratus]|uniref:Sidoreflexin n=1 Tax=Strongylocentrotus purpuratus TaxID=7668 RepID=A0A7M7NYV7_STRPU|nr:sideroflexin-1 [Strongylocentrotus purpuratus]